ncbi:MAG: tRNA nucleotidyltransferase [Balneola sp.]|jgi:tRNA nucleotidyltransferase (CCA-adding enzyme)|nr:tRNA nucleotidyltransferase [Balneola sp.]MBE77794.1 tRNA nucleotidyltransferase [Balneola sp.]HBX66396.1 tRNA nucleotidyltransferase [Balneolaceae bacterium]|tara:strand:+ start:5781 stop:7190 length:1410 start_codon:yes stop_codon:yes gene_type:complete
MQNIPKKHQTVFNIISEAAQELESPVYVVGGYVRDYYLGRSKSGDIDIDFVTVGSGINLARKVSDKIKGSSLAVYNQFGTAQVKTGDLELEFVGARKESYRKNSRKPLVEDGTLEDDQLRRDLTINALSWSLNKEDYGALNDPFNGMNDLEQSLIRTPIDPEQTFDDDPLRMMRAIRFASQLDFRIEEETFDAITKMSERINIISKERIIEELNKIILSDNPSLGFTMLFKTELLKEFFPEMYNLHGVKEVNGVRHKDNFWHTLQVLDNVIEMDADLWLRWSAIMHDIAKPPTQRFHKEAGWTFHGHDALGAKWTKKIFRRLGLPLDERMRYVRKLVRLHLRPIALVSDEVSDSAIRRLIYEAGEDIDDLMKLCRADITTKNDYKQERYQKNFDYVERRIQEVEEKDRIRKWKNPLSGEEIMKALEIKPSRTVGDVKDAVKEAILNGDIPNEHDAAFEFMMEHKDEFLK